MDAGRVGDMRLLLKARDDEGLVVWPGDHPSSTRPRPFFPGSAAYVTAVRVRAPHGSPTDGSTGTRARQAPRRAAPGAPSAVRPRDQQRGFTSAALTRGHTRGRGGPAGSRSRARRSGIAPGRGQARGRRSSCCRGRRADRGPPAIAARAARAQARSVSANPASRRGGDQLDVRTARPSEAANSASAAQAGGRRAGRRHGHATDVTCSRRS